MHHRIAHGCIALAATIALGAASAALAQGRDKAGPKYQSAAPAHRMMAAPSPPSPPPPPATPMESAMPATPAYAACSATVQDHCMERAAGTARPRHGRHRPR